MYYAEKKDWLKKDNTSVDEINGLIASHFNRTYVIDGRHYNDFKVFDYINYNLCI